MQEKSCIDHLENGEYNPDIILRVCKGWDQGHMT